MDVLILLCSFALLLTGAVVFTNAVEWAGKRLSLGTGAVGSILAAVATALPESTIPMVAIISGEESGQIAIGAIIGAPLLLGTIAMLLVALSSRGFKGRRDQGTRLRLHRRTTVRDLTVFLALLGMAVGLGLIGSTVLNLIGAGICVLTYAIYVWRSIRAGGETGGELDPLHFDPSKQDPPRNWQIISQVVLSLATIIVGAQLFVYVVEDLAVELGVSALVLALILAPLATELPEKANSFFWVRKGKDTLALGNITGAMVFQSSIPVAVGLVFTPWQLKGPAALAGACALAGGALALVEVLRKGKFSLLAMIVWAALYAGFVVVTVLTR